MIPNQEHNAKQDYKSTSSLHTEVQQIHDRYERRKQIPESTLYHPLSPYVFMVLQELDRALFRWVHQCKLMPVSEKRVLEIGCGSGSNLLRLINMGFRPQNMVANELSQERAANARLRLPDAVKVLPGDALKIDEPQESFDIVLQSTVFTSILRDDFQHALAKRMWDLVAPGGGVLWYDFKYNNPRNPDVRGIPTAKLRKLFPMADIKTWNLTLAPPLGRVVTRKNTFLYHVFNSVPLLRTHVLSWIKK